MVHAFDERDETDRLRIVQNNHVRRAEWTVHPVPLTVERNPRFV